MIQKKIPFSKTKLLEHLWNEISELSTKLNMPNLNRI